LETLERSGERGRGRGNLFTNPSVGYVRSGPPDSGRLYRTTDGGESWTGIGASPGNEIRFADPEVGWSFHYNRFSFTTNAGTRWTFQNVCISRIDAGF
jgi:photosystem II stability/assembly factor-like uncharacterized protein